MKTIEEMEAEQSEAIASAGVSTEKEMREADSPWPGSEAELLETIRTLAVRPHDYGTCCYAMSLAAIAAMNYVASKLGVTGFQAGCAMMDIIRRHYGWELGGRLLDYSNLLYPQYCNASKFPSVDDLLADEGIRKSLANAARKKLEASDGGEHPHVREHWQRLARLTENVKGGDA